MDGPDYSGVIKITFGPSQIAAVANLDESPARWRDTVSLTEHSAGVLFGRLGDALRLVKANQDPEGSV